MECNRDEALRAKEIAERKLASQDYDGARKFLQKALQLFPGLENTAQMSAVLDVHIAAQAKINGSETDWYGILQVDPRAEDILIKKQYKKLALLLHPDKNKSSGAEAAFKLIGEALQVLSDKQQRALHDSRRKQVSKSGSSVHRTQNRHTNVAPFVNTPNTTASLTFMTICPACHTRFQYYRLYENHNVLCQQCHTPFIAREYLSGLDNGNYSAYVWSHQYPHHQQHFNGSFQHYSTSGSFQTNPSSTYAFERADHSNKVFKEKEGVNTVPGTKRKRNDEAEKEMRKIEKEKQRKARADQKAQEAMEKMKRKKRRQKRHSDSFSDDDDDLTEDSIENLSDDQLVNQSVDTNAAPRRSSRPRRTVTYKVDESDEEEDRPSGTKVQVKEAEGKPNSVANAQNEDSVDVNAKQKLANLVKVRIRQNLNLQMCDDDEDHPSGRKMEDKEGKASKEVEKSDANAQNMDSVGVQAKQKLGVKIRIHDNIKLQHVLCDNDVHCPLGTKVEDKVSEGKASKEVDKSYAIDQNLGSIDVNAKHKIVDHGKVRVHQNLNLQNVNVCDKRNGSDIDAGEVKEKATQNVLRRDGLDDPGIDAVTMKNGTNPDIRHSTDIDADNIRASTDIKISTTLDECFEKKENCVESSKLQESPKKDNTLNKDTHGSNKRREKRHANEEAKVKREPVEDKEVDRDINEGKSEEDGLTVPDPDFYNFDNEREEKDVAVGQIWAAYDDKEGLPRYYFKVKDVVSRVPFKIIITWLELRNMSDDQRALRDLGCYPVCGACFRGASSQILESVGIFSHILVWEKGPKGAIKIYPKKGQIWAVFKGWKPGLRARRKNGYDMVEVLGDFNEQAGVCVVFLEKLTEYKTVFKCTKNYLNISATDVCRFSFQVPAHKLQGTEAPGIQEGFWELDPASVPNDIIFSHSSVKSN